MRIDFVTLFPEMVLPAARHSILRRAEDAGLVSFGAANPRDFATDAHRTVDDRPYGGGPGMVMRPDVVAAAIRSVAEEGAEVVFTDPMGEAFRQQSARELAQSAQVVFVCGHYEGVDERVRRRIGTRTYSIGDFVLTGGELPALVMADAVVRLIPGALGDEASLDADCFADGILSHPQYTRPEVWEGEAVPPVLLSGDHGAVSEWRRSQGLRATLERRPDLLPRARLDRRDGELLPGLPGLRPSG